MKPGNMFSIILINNAALYRNYLQTKHPATNYQKVLILDQAQTEELQLVDIQVLATSQEMFQFKHT